MHWEQCKPEEIEARSFAIIEQELSEPLDPELAPVIKRVIHTTADFDYAKNLYFSSNVVEILRTALRGGAHVVTDTNMAKAGINTRKLVKYGGAVHCYMADEDVREIAKQEGTTRAYASMSKAARTLPQAIYAIGNAPTALLRIVALVREGALSPAAVIAVPVGFVNVVQAKAMIRELQIPSIIANGRKGGSAVAAAIINALL